MTYDNALFGYVFFGGASLVVLWEWLAPRRQVAASLRPRWIGNFALYALNNLAIRFAFPLLSIGFALWTIDHGLGILEQVALPHWTAVAVSILVLDFSKYLQHFLLHRVPLLWRFHRIHHADQDYDFTTGLRSHPVEAIFSVLFLFGSIVILGPAVVAVFVHEAISLFQALIVHGNIRVPIPLDRIIRFVVITPDVHRIHHSVVISESNSNFGASVPWWDRLFGTYTDQPAAGHEGMAIGLAECRERKHMGLMWALVEPFRRDNSQNHIPSPRVVQTTSIT